MADGIVQALWYRCRTFGPSYDPIGNESPLPESKSPFRRTGMGHYWTGCVRRSSRSLVNINNNHGPMVSELDFQTGVYRYHWFTGQFTRSTIQLLAICWECQSLKGLYIRTCNTLFCIGNNATMRTLPTIFIIHPSFNDWLQLRPKVSDMERFFPYDGRLSVIWVGAIPTETI